MHSTLPTEIWNQFVSGDTSCFRQLFKNYYQGLYGYGLKLCNDPELVEDGIQELFESVWQRRNELTHITSPNVYLYVSLRRSVLKRKKKQDKMKGLKHAGLPSETSGSEQAGSEDLFIHFGAEDIIIKAESRKLQKKELQKALNQLSNQQKEVIYLHYYNGMSYSEISKILSINRQSVSNHMYRAMETLRTVLRIDVMRLVI